MVAQHFEIPKKKNVKQCLDALVKQAKQVILIKDGVTITKSKVKTYIFSRLIFYL